jgi:DivIVA domain-containing protein
MIPNDIKSQRFGTRLLWGLRPEEVSAFLEDVADAYDDLKNINASLRARVQGLEEEIRALATRGKETSASTPIEVLRAATLREVEALLHDAQANAQTLIDAARETEAAILREAEAAKARMQIEAEEHVARATDRAASLIMTAREQEAAIRGEIDRLAQSRLQLVDEIRAALDTYEQWLATVDPHGRARGRREALEMSNGNDESVTASDEVRAG